MLRNGNELFYNVAVISKKEFDQSTVYMLLAMVFTMIVVGDVFGSLSNSGVIDRNNIFVLMAFSAIQFTLFLCVVFAFWIISGIGKDGFRQIWLDRVSIRPQNTMMIIVLTVLCMVSFFLVVGAFEEFLCGIGFSSDNNNNRLAGMNSFEIYLLMVLVSAVLPAVVEELIFRGAILRGFVRYGPVVAVIVSSVLFSLFHLNPLQTVYQFALGVVLALVVLKTGKLIYAIILHFINNFVIITYTYIAGTSEIPVTWNIWTGLLTVTLLIVGVLAISFVLRNLKNERQENANEQEQKQEREKLFSVDSIGVFIVIALLATIWFAILLS